MVDERSYEGTDQVVKASLPGRIWALRLVVRSAVLLPLCPPAAHSPACTRPDRLCLSPVYDMRCVLTGAGLKSGGPR